MTALALYRNRGWLSFVPQMLCLGFSLTVLHPFKFLAKFNLLPTTFAPKVELEKIVRDHGWDKQRKQ